jgi:hypothetical protein
MIGPIKGEGIRMLLYRFVVMTLTPIGKGGCGTRYSIGRTRKFLFLILPSRSRFIAVAATLLSIAT